MKKHTLLLFSILALSSCTIVGLTNDFSKLTDEEKNLIVTNTDFLDLKNKKIHVVNGQDLKNEFKKNEKSMVYIFTNGCPSDYCLPMNSYENYAVENNYKLYLVMSGYGNLQSALQQNFNSPLFAIDYSYYDTKFRSVAVRKLENDLRGRPLNYKEKIYEGNIFFFEKDKLVKVVQEL